MGGDAVGHASIFGLEFTINLGRPEIGGHRRWLGQNGGSSSLCDGNNRFAQSIRY